MRSEAPHGTVPENDGIQIERVLDYASGGDSDPQYVLLCGQIVGLGDAIDVCEITGRGA